MNFNPIKAIAFLLIVLAWILMTFFFVGCANVSYKTIPDGMSEDAQDYPTKYNMMDSPDGRRNPNAQINIFGATYWQFLSLQYIEYMSKKKFKNALKFFKSLNQDEQEVVARNYVEMSKMDLIELIFQNRPYYNDLEKIVNTHRKELAHIQKEILATKKEQKKKLAEFKSGVRYKVTIYTITDDISNKHGSSSEHILESYADEAENDAYGCVTREEEEEYMTDAELNDWAEFNGAEKELAEWRQQMQEENLSKVARG